MAVFKVRPKGWLGGAVRWAEAVRWEKTEGEKRLRLTYAVGEQKRDTCT